MKYSIIIFVILSIVSCNQKDENTEDKKDDFLVDQPKQVSEIKIEDSYIVNDEYITVLEKDWFKKGYYYTLDDINIYSKPNDQGASVNVKNCQALLFRVDNLQEWLYVSSLDDVYKGYIKVYDISETSFYGDYTKNEESGNYYLKKLNKEYLILKDNPTIKRYGPLLELYINDEIHKIWDDFGEHGYRYTINTFIDDDLIMFEEQHYEGGKFVLYDVGKRTFISSSSNIPVFNDNKDIISSCGFVYGDVFLYEILEKSDDKFALVFEYCEIENTYIYSKPDFSYDVKWINDELCIVDLENAPLTDKALIIKLDSNTWDFEYYPVNANNYGDEEIRIIEQFKEVDKFIAKEIDRTHELTEDDYVERKLIVDNLKELYFNATHRM